MNKILLLKMGTKDQDGLEEIEAVNKKSRELWATTKPL